MAKPTLIVFVKVPRLGAVKTRLARAIGPLAAWRFYRETTTTLLARIGWNPRWRTVLAVTPDAFASKGRFWPRAFARVPQGRGDIGRRMARSIADLGHGPTVLVGGDIPDIEARHIGGAFRALASADIVFGPAEDGGFWLVGTRDPRVLRGAFRDVRWSSPTTLADTLSNLRHRRVALAATLADVDDAAGLTRISRA
jgi:rSAM/selenodomain-associated transferase 1